MDHVLDIADRYILTPYVYPASWPEDGALRQVISLLVLTNMGAELLYLGFAAFSFYYVFDHRLLKHPHFIENQLQREIRLGVTSIFWMSFPTVALFFAEIRGYSKLYDNITKSPSDMVIYWMHRVLHHKSLYKVSWRWTSKDIYFL
ncbi:Lathosterol oxidase [Merluccius polli]|uniref:Lathosterol oxidase n=1 Tax=Merluccius polli TaxID=89951 RepID=A0AA47NV49_MERPO|nr:Lathosterol oxidase [Merluccius polli]